MITQVLLLGAQRRLSARRGTEPPGYLAKQGRFDIGSPNAVLQYYGDDVIFYDAVDRVYGSVGKSQQPLLSTQSVQCPSSQHTSSAEPDWIR